MRLGATTRRLLCVAPACILVALACADETSGTRRVPADGGDESTGGSSAGTGGTWAGTGGAGGNATGGSLWRPPSACPGFEAPVPFSGCSVSPSDPSLCTSSARTVQDTLLEGCCRSDGECGVIWPALPDSTTTCTNITCPQCFSPSGQAVSCPSLGSCVPLSSLPQYSVTLPPCELPNPTVNCNYPYGGGPDASFSSDASLANDADSSNEASLASDADSSSDASLANDADSSNDATGGNDGGSNDVPAKTDCGASGTGGSTAECSYTPVVSDHPDCLDTVLTYTMCAKGFGSPWGCISPEYDVPGCCLPCGQCGLALTGAPFQPDGCHSYEQLAAFARAYYDPSPDPPSYGTFQVTGVPNGNGNDCYYRAP